MSHPNVVFLVADQNYLPVAWTAAQTAAAQSERNFDVVLITDAAGQLPPPPAGCRIMQVAAPPARPGWPVAAHSSAITYSRLAAAEVWLRDYDRAVYLDSDISIHGPLAPMFSLDLQGAILAMVEDCGRYLRDPPDAAHWAQQRREMGMDPALPYFNSGVIVMELGRMRAMGFWRSVQDFMATHQDRLVFMDQDALNGVAAGQIAELSPRWNFQTHYFGLGLEAKMPPIIRHYADVLKPWRDPEWQLLYGMQAPRHFARLFAKSPWKNYMPRGLYAHLRLAAQIRAAQILAQNARNLTPEYIAAHLENYKTRAQELQITVGRGLAKGEYIDALLWRK